MNSKTYFLYAYFVLLCVIPNYACAQSTKEEKMEQLSFLVGEWIGTSTLYENGKISKQSPAFEKISYDLEGSILVIELSSELLQLRTIVTYNEEDQSYYYHRFSKEGAAIYPAEFKEGQLIVWKDEQTRFFFGRTPNGDFQEYGEQYVNDRWVKTFEDTFTNTQ